MNRFYFLAIFVASFGSLAAQHAKDNNALPNVIIIYADDLGYGDLGCFGHPTINTPFIDQMAQEGMRMTQFYVGANVCTPSRAALLTGRLPIRYGMAGDERRDVLFPNSANGLPTDEITLARLLKMKNYRTAVIGKWHLGHLPDFLPSSHGFDYFFGIPYSNDMIPEDGGWPPLPVYKNDDVIETAPDQRQLTKRYTKEALTFIKQNKDHPFFLYYPNNFPHVPLYASADFEGKSKRGIYGDVVSELDWSVGKILNTLKELSLDKNTLVVFASDNGPWLLLKQHGGSAGLLYEGKGSAYEGGMRVPAIFWWPGTINPGQTNSALATTMDIFPTVCELTGLSLQADKPYDGVSLVPLFTNAKQEVREFVYYYTKSELYAIRKGPFKAHFTTKPSYRKDIPPTQHPVPLLYNLEIDPSEKYNISNSYPEIVKELRAEFDKHTKAVVAAPGILFQTYWDKK